jgi:hypothetical protein
VPVESNAAELAGRFTRAAAELRGGTGAEPAMGAVMLAAAVPPRDTGAYAGSIAVTGTPPVVGLTAGGGRVDYAHIIEFGSVHVRGRRVLGRAVESTRAQWTDLAAAGVQAIVDRI